MLRPAIGRPQRALQSRHGRRPYLLVHVQYYYMHTPAHMCACTYHACTHTHTHTCTYAHMHARIHAHTQERWWKSSYIYSFLRWLVWFWRTTWVLLSSRAYWVLPQAPIQSWGGNLAPTAAVQVWEGEWGVCMHVQLSTWIQKNAYLIRKVW